MPMLEQIWRVSHEWLQRKMVYANNYLVIIVLCPELRRFQSANLRPLDETLSTPEAPLKSVLTLFLQSTNL